MEVQEVIELMQNLDIPDELIPSLVMTAYFESGLNQNVININREDDGTITEDRSYLQLNIDKFFFEDGTPDETIKTYFKKINSFKPNFGFTDEVVFKLLEWKSEGKVTHVDKLIDKMS